MAGTENDKAGGARRISLATTCGIHAVQDGLYATVYVLLPVVTPVFGLSYFQVGFLRAAFSTAMTLVQIPSGMLAERLGERVLLVFGLGCAGLGFLLASTSLTIASLFLGLFLAGLGAAFQHAPSSSLIARTFQGGTRGPALGAYNAAGDVGKLAFTAMFSLAIGMGLGWHQTIAGLGVIAIATAIAVSVIFRRLDIGGRPATDLASPEEIRKLGWGIRNRAGFAALTAIVFLDLAVQSGFLTFVALLMAEKQVPTGLAALAVVLTLAGGVCGKLGCGFLTRRLGPRLSLVVVQCATAAGIVIVLVSPPTVSFLVLPLLGVVLQGSSTITYGSVADLVHAERQSRGFAFIYSVSSAAGIAGPIIFGVIGDQFGLAPAMLAMAAAASLSLPLCGALQTRARAVPGNDQTEDAA